MDIKIRPNNPIQETSEQPDATQAPDANKTPQSESIDTISPSEPDFISNLLEGTFQSVVDGSVQQMNEYGDLLKNAAESVNEFDSTTTDQRSSSSDRKDDDK